MYTDCYVDIVYMREKKKTNKLYCNEYQQNDLYNVIKASQATIYPASIIISSLCSRSRLHVEMHSYLSLYQKRPITSIRPHFQYSPHRKIILHPAHNPTAHIAHQPVIMRAREE